MIGIRKWGRGRALGARKTGAREERTFGFSIGDTPEQVLSRSTRILHIFVDEEQGVGDALELVRGTEGNRSLEAHAIAFGSAI